MNADHLEKVTMCELEFEALLYGYRVNSVCLPSKVPT